MLSKVLFIPKFHIFQGVQSKLRNRRSTSLKRRWFWIRFFKFISQKEVTFVTIKTKVKEREPLFCCWTCTILLLMVGKFEREISTKLITLLILRLPAKIQKYQIGWPVSERGNTTYDYWVLNFLFKVDHHQMKHRFSSPKCERPVFSHSIFSHSGAVFWPGNFALWEDLLINKFPAQKKNYASKKSDTQYNSSINPV